MRTGETGETSWSKAENQQQTQPTYGVDAAGFEPGGGGGGLKQGRKISDICLKQGQGRRGRAAPPHPGIYRVPPSRDLNQTNIAGRRVPSHHLLPRILSLGPFTKSHKNTQFGFYAYIKMIRS